MGFRWEDDQEETLEFTHDVLEDEKEIKVSCTADNPGCTNRGTDIIKLCWDIMNEMIFSDGVFLWKNKEFHVDECTKCNNYYIMKNKAPKFVCEDCR